MPRHLGPGSMALHSYSSSSGSRLWGGRITGELGI